MKLKHMAVAASLMASGSAFAGVTGNVGAVSEYMFRGLSQTGNGAAIQGGIDYSHASGLYVGTWGSNIDWGAGGSEVDLYGGFAGKIGDSGFGYDLGAIYYYYPEKGEATPEIDANTLELYAALSFGPVSLKYFYSPSYFGLKEAGGDDASNSYVLLSAAYPLSDTLNLTATAGYTISSDDVWLDGPDGLVGTDSTDSYVDYSIGLSKAVDPSLTASFAIVGTDFSDDDPQIVIGLKKTFDL